MTRSYSGHRYKITIQCHILNILYDDGPCPITHIVRLTETTHKEITAILRDFIIAGLVIPQNREAASFTPLQEARLAMNVCKVFTITGKGVECLNLMNKAYSFLTSQK